MLVKYPLKNPTKELQSDSNNLHSSTTKMQLHIFFIQTIIYSKGYLDIHFEKKENYKNGDIPNMELGFSVSEGFDSCFWKPLLLSCCRTKKLSA